MGLPGKRLSSSSKRRRAAHFALDKKVFVACSQCKKDIMPHRTCPFCGTYKARSIVDIKLPKRMRTAIAGAVAQAMAQKAEKSEKADKKEQKAEE